MQQVYSPYNQYRQHQNNAVQDADPVTLITMLLEGAISLNKKAKLCLEQDDTKTALEAVENGTKIVMHLYASLDFDNGGEIAEKLGSLYHYVCDQYVLFQKDPKDMAPLESINQVLVTILDGWKQIPKEDK
ncbi:MAG: flagellar export chaperone FliS [Deltaproteobacteria bacterium]|nr:flagellar export chaperone FliS [Deltaproteobacteria bacterium]